MLEVYSQPKIIKSIVLNHFGIYEYKLGARKCTLRELSKLEAKTFFEENHLKGFKTSSKSYGLFFEDKIVSAMSITIKDNMIKIDRFCSQLNYSVSGAFSKLLKQVSRDHPNKDIISFCDLRYATGSSYEKLNFKKEKTTIGFEWTDGHNLYNRLRCRANMDDRRLTQVEHAKELGWYKIYDAGQVKYIKKIEKGG